MLAKAVIGVILWNIITSVKQLLNAPLQTTAIKFLQKKIILLYPTFEH